MGWRQPKTSHMVKRGSLFDELQLEFYSLTCPVDSARGDEGQRNSKLLKKS